MNPLKKLEACGQSPWQDYLKRSLLEKGELRTLIDRNKVHTQALTAMRARVRDRTHAATCLGFGPRFQHSTGQAYKGCPNSGVFLQVTCDDPADIDVPGHSYSFGVVKAAQARGDLDVLVGRGWRALRVHIKVSMRDWQSWRAR